MRLEELKQAIQQLLIGMSGCGHGYDRSHSFFED